MRLIDADAIRKLLDENLVNVCHDVVLKVIDEAPTIELIRCKECKYWESPYKVLDHFNCGEWCQIDERECKADDFCSYGELYEDIPMEYFENGGI